MKADPTTRESLQAEAEVDPMEGEQTWPTESELLEAEGADTQSSTSAFFKIENASLHQVDLNHRNQDRYTALFILQRPGRPNES